MIISKLISRVDSISYEHALRWHRHHWWLINIGSDNGRCLGQQAITWVNVDPGLCRHMLPFNSIFFFSYLKRRWTQGTEKWLRPMKPYECNCLLAKWTSGIRKIEEIVCLAYCGSKQTTDRILLCSKCPQMCQNISNKILDQGRAVIILDILPKLVLNPNIEKTLFYINRVAIVFKFFDSIQLYTTLMSLKKLQTFVLYLVDVWRSATALRCGNRTPSWDNLSAWRRDKISNK